jgi:hypothetical protein
VSDHTPGPWEIWYGGFPGDTYFTVGHTGADGSTGVVCEYTPAVARPEKELLANAHLVKASPELLAACEELVRALSPETGRVVLDATRRELHPLKVMAQAAIARAKGGDS